jgi:hypothetical protein
MLDSLPPSDSLDSEISPGSRPVPPLVHAILAEIARMRSAGELTEAEMERKVTRLTREELRPRGFKVLHRNLANGGLRFLVKSEDTGAVCDLVECRPGSVAA